jgi:hypothetical protein
VPTHSANFVINSRSFVAEQYTNIIHVKQQIKDQMCLLYTIKIVVFSAQRYTPGPLSAFSAAMRPDRISTHLSLYFLSDMILFCSYKCQYILFEFKACTKFNKLKHTCASVKHLGRVNNEKRGVGEVLDDAADRRTDECHLAVEHGLDGL